MIKVGIDASRLRSGMTGAGRYAAGIVAALDAVMSDAHFILYARQECAINLPSDRWRVVCDKHVVWSRLPVTLWIHFRLGHLVNADIPDVLWAPNTLLPRGLPSRVRCVASVMDFNHIFVPRTLPPITRFANKQWMDADVMRASRNVAISKGTSERMFQLLGRRADAIAYPAVPHMPAVPEESAVIRILEQMGVRRPYLLTVGARGPRKNLANAVAAVEILRKRGMLLHHQLVMAGPEGWGSRDRSSERGQGREWINPLGFVDDLSLAVLYSKAEALIYPSLYEGFGMPVIEARAHGCRVVTTDSPELREAGGKEAIYIEPTPLGIAVGIEESLKRAQPVAHRAQHGWKGAAQVLADVLYDVIAEH